MRLEMVTFRESVTFMGYEALRLQTTDKTDRRSYTPVLQLADGKVWWSELDWSSEANVRHARKAQEVEPERVAHVTTDDAGAVVSVSTEPPKKGKKR